MAQCEGQSRNRNKLVVILSMLQDSLIQFLHLAHTGIKGAAFLPGGEPASGADVGEEKLKDTNEV